MLTHLYGPAVRCKLNLQNGWSCASVYGPCVEQNAPGHYGYPRAFGLILRSALEGQLGHLITNALARPFLHLLIFDSQTSAGKLNFCFGDQLEPSPRSHLFGYEAEPSRIIPPFRKGCSIAERPPP